METKNYTELYDVLGVTQHATPDQIKKAYYKLSTEFHPDKTAGDPHKTDMFHKIKAAYEILSNPVKRRKYDEAGQTEFLNEDKEMLVFVNEVIIPTILTTQESYVEKVNLLFVIREGIERIIDKGKGEIKKYKDQQDKIEKFLKRVKQKDEVKATKTNVLFQPKINMLRQCIQATKDQIEICKMLLNLFEGAEYMNEDDYLALMFKSTGPTITKD